MELVTPYVSSNIIFLDSQLSSCVDFSHQPSTPGNKICPSWPRFRRQRSQQCGNGTNCLQPRLPQRQEHFEFLSVERVGAVYLGPGFGFILPTTTCLGRHQQGSYLERYLQALPRFKAPVYWYLLYTQHFNNSNYH